MCVSALDDLNRELREEEKKNAGLRDEIAQLHRLVGSHAQFSNVRVPLRHPHIHASSCGKLSLDTTSNIFVKFR